MYIKDRLIGSLLLFLFLISGCQGKWGFQPKETSLPDLQPELMISLSGKKIKLSEINKAGNYTLNLSDEFLFNNLKGLKGFQKSDKKKRSDSIAIEQNDSIKEVNLTEGNTSTPKNISSESLASSDKAYSPMEVSMACLMEGKKYTFKKELSYYRSHFYIIDLLPEALLIEHEKENPVSCSFLFIIRDRDKNEYLYNIPLLPLMSVSNNSSLKILNDKNKPLSEHLIRKDNMNHFDLILEQGREAQKIKFLCEKNIDRDIAFILSEKQSLISPFKLLRSMKTEQLPSGKDKCRILTYEKIPLESGTDVLSQVYRANGISGSFYIDFETLRERETFTEPDLSKEKLIIKSQSEGEVKLFEIKEGKKYEWNLSDEILFTGLSDFLKGKPVISTQMKQSSSVETVISIDENNSSIDKAPSLMEVSTNCLMKWRPEDSVGKVSNTFLKQDRWMRKKEFTDYQSHFYFVDLLPEELLINYKKESLVSCSLSFILRNKKGKQYSYDIPSLPVRDIQKSAFLKLLNASNKEMGWGEIVNADNMSHFTLIFKEGKKTQKIKFLCGKEKPGMSFNMDPDIFFLSPFQFLQSLESEQLPSGKKQCRILAYGKNQIVNGVTEFFQIDFETLRDQANLWMPSADALQITIDEFVSRDISQFNRRQRHAKMRKKSIHITSAFEIPELFKIFPENFTKEEYQSYKIKVDTECFSSILYKYKEFQKEHFATETYYLPLLDSFSVMSVMPREALQIYLPDNLPEILSEIHSDYLRPNSRSQLAEKERNKIKLKDYRQWFTCSYHFQIQNRKGEISSIGWIKNRPVYWNQGSYGLGFKEKKAKESFPLTLMEAKPIKIDLLFLQNTLQPNGFFDVDSLWPDKVIFSCGGRHPSKDYKPGFQTTFERSIPMQKGSFEIPLSFFLNRDDFQDYFKDNKLIKCRVILEKKDILWYFSQDLKFIYEDGKFFEGLNNISEDDTLWNFNSLSRFLYWL